MSGFKYLFLIIIFLSSADFSLAESKVFSASVSKESLRTLKRMEYKEGIPNGMLHAISLVETNIGQTGRYRPWPYTIRLNRYKSQDFNNVDLAYEKLEKLFELGYQTFDLITDKEKYYSLSFYSLEDILSQNPNATKYIISARSVIKYFKSKQEASVQLNKLIANKWYEFRVGIMQLNYQDVTSNTADVTDSLNAYNNINIMVRQLKGIRSKHSWWESVGLYHSERPEKAKRYVKNVWSMYQRVHKIKVR